MTEKSLKILIISNTLAKGGKERQIIELVRWMTSNTNHSVGICLREDCVEYPVDFQNRIAFYKPTERLTFRKLFNYHREVIKQFCPDIIHTWEGGVALSISLNRLLLCKRVKVIDGCIRYSKKFTYKSKDYWISLFNHWVADKVVTNSAAGLRSLGYGKGPKFRVIPNGFDFGRFSRGKDQEKTTGSIRNIGMVASFSQAKDYEGFIAAATGVLKLRTDVHFFCIGEGSSKEAVMKSIPPDLLEHFTFTGNVVNPEDFITEFSIGVLLNKPGHSEGMSNSIMEYMMLGLPVICTNTGGNPELVEEGRNGYLLEFGDVPGITAKMIALLENPGLCSEMGNRSRQIALERFSIENLGRQYMDLYNSLSEN
jgi:glycosyltransferase involved in cell wall biosynthesis